jgi:hypothetical protein
MKRFTPPFFLRITAVFLAAVVFAALFCPRRLCAMDWPSREGVLIRNFGFNDRGRPVLGTVFEAQGEVAAAEAGEVIFSRTAADSASRLPSPLGAWTALDHGDGLISVYSRCEDPGGVSPPPRAGRGSPIAAAGKTGWSARTGFYFILYDRRERRWINPSMIITPLPDTQPPRITAVELRNAQGAEINAAQLRGLSQGRYAVLVAASDSISGGGESSLSPHRIVCSVNGTEIGSLNFETISARDGVLMVYRNGLVPAKRIYAPYPAFEAGEVLLNRGQASMEVIVQDIAGNSRSSIVRITVN